MWRSLILLMETPRHSFGVSWCQPRWYLVATRIIVASVGQQCQSRFHVRRVQACSCRRVLGGHETRVHRCTGTRYGPLLHRLMEFLGKSLSIFPPHRVARWKLVDLSASLDCSAGFCRSCLPRRLARRELVVLSASHSC